MRQPIHFPSLLALALACGGLAACGNISRGIAPDGLHAQTLRWPDPASTPYMHRGGTYPDPAQLRRLQAGMSKAQIMALIGPPHFNEGFAGVREWDYLFHLRAPDSGQMEACQYKILFDDHQIARSFYWRDPACAHDIEPPAPPAAASAAPPANPLVGQTLRLSADALFGFDQYAVAAITPSGREELDALAGKIQAAGAAVKHITITGYTDRLGGAAYNVALSRKRAQSVQAYLEEHGVPAQEIQAEGRGAADPVVSCEQHGRAARIVCLAPNRRVEVRVSGEA